ncbi:hypothetical protein [Neomoorella thermoacetica]|uniref:hypothetical protein n=1 Tax=Neomoorella thermoacetica TaxID=1525 RepID=UPI00084C6ABC|nr:hypothetical protein [Moorella thermoacetica]
MESSLEEVKQKQNGASKEVKVSWGVVLEKIFAWILLYGSWGLLIYTIFRLAYKMVILPLTISILSGSY